MDRESLENLVEPRRWPARQLRAVGITFRESAGRGLDAVACLERAVAAYVAAGGTREKAAPAVLEMIAALSMEEGDWLWGPAQALRERQSAAAHQPDLFEPLAPEPRPC